MPKLDHCILAKWCKHLASFLENKIPRRHDYEVKKKKEASTIIIAYDGHKKEMKEI